MDDRDQGNLDRRGGAMFPLANKSYTSMSKMKTLQPKMAELKEKYGDDKQRINTEMMALYKREKVNPAAGCLPLLIQLPILFGMYSAMNQLATLGLTLDQVTASQVGSGQVVYAAERHQDPLPYNQFVLARLTVVPQTSGPIELDVPQDQAAISHNGQPRAYI